MGELRFNLHDALSELKLQEAIAVAPDLGPVIDDLRAKGVSPQEIVKIFADLIKQMESEFPTRKPH